VNLSASIAVGSSHFECRVTDGPSCGAAREVFGDVHRPLNGSIDYFSTQADVLARETNVGVNRLFPAYFPLKFSCFFPGARKWFRLIPAIPHPQMGINAGNRGYLRINAGNKFKNFLRRLPNGTGAGQARSALTNGEELGCIGAL
jgi:hypothetical protein